MRLAQKMTVGAALFLDRVADSDLNLEIVVAGPGC